MTKCMFLCGSFCRNRSSHREAHAPSTLNIHAHKHTSAPLQWREVMKTNGRVLFPLGPEEELSHQANFILVWPRDSISSGCFYKCRAAPRHRPVMDMRAWWPDGRCWPCNSSSKHSLMTPLALHAFFTQCTVAAPAPICKHVCSKQTLLLFSTLACASMQFWLQSISIPPVGMKVNNNRHA